VHDAASATTDDELRRRVASLEASLASVTAERDKLRRAYEQLKEHLELLRRRIFMAKAERVDIAQLELEFADTKAKLDKLAQDLTASDTPASDTSSSDTPQTPPCAQEPEPPPKIRNKPSGRRTPRSKASPSASASSTAIDCPTDAQGPCASSSRARRTNRCPRAAPSP